MADATDGRAVDFAAVLTALPTGIVIYDSHRRIVYLNPAFERSMGLPPGLFRPGTSMEEAVRVVAHRGLFGPGDPEVLATEMIGADDRLPRHYSRRRSDGGTFESQYLPLASGFAVAITDTTQLTALGERAEQASARVHDAMAHLQVGLAVFGPDRRLGLHNPRFLQLLGLPADQPIGTVPFGDLLRSAGATPTYAGAPGAEFLTRQRAQDRSRASRTVWSRPDGVDVQYLSDPLETGGWTMTLLDISAQVAAEAEVRRRAAQLETIIQHLPSGVVVFGPDHRLTLFNDAYRAVMRGATGELGELDRDLVWRQAKAGEFGPGAPARLAEERMAVLESSSVGVSRRRRPDGRIIEVRKAPLPDGGMVRVLTDVSAEEAAVAERTRHAETMNTMLSHIRHGIVLWDRDQRIIASNSVVTDLLGAEPGLFVPGTTLPETITAAYKRGNFGEGATGRQLAVALAARDRTRSHVDQRATRSGRVLEVRSDPTPDGGFVTTYTDVTPIREAEAALQEAKSGAERANLAKSGFLAAMSQELRRPLAHILEQAALIMREAEGLAGPDVLRAAQEVTQVGQAMLSRLGNILDVARLEAGRFELAEEIMALGPLVRDALAAADQSAAAAEVGLTAHLPTPEPRIRGDRRRLLSTLDHVIRHALTLTGPGAVVTVGATEGPDGLYLTVTTPQIMLTATARDRAFDPFSPSDDGSGRLAALRLGLYSSRIVVQAHGGTLRLDSVPGEGTVARLHLPPARVLAPAGAGRWPQVQDKVAE